MKTPPRGRGAASNPANRFTGVEIVSDPDAEIDEASSPATVFLKDSSGTIIATNDSPDVGFTASVNPYRGCEHGCSYCYARPTHEYFGFSSGLDFETKILVKENAAELLRRELEKPGWQPQVIAMSGVTDPYQPAERRIKITRSCLEVLRDHRNPVAIITKNHLVARDIDILSELAAHDAALVLLSITTLDADLAARLEPRASRPEMRLRALRELSAAKIPCGVMTAPVIPGLTDSEIPSILAEAAKAGACCAGYTMLRLPHAVAPLFEAWLAEHYPDRKEKVLSRLRSLRGGELNDPRFGSRMRGEGVFADQVKQLFELGKRQASLNRGWPELSTAMFRRRPEQMGLFE